MPIKNWNACPLCGTKLSERKIIDLTVARLCECGNCGAFGTSRGDVPNNGEISWSKRRKDINVVFARTGPRESDSEVDSGNIPEQIGDEPKKFDARGRPPKKRKVNKIVRRSR